MGISATKIFEFAYAHYLPQYEGNCQRLHGHTGKLEVTVERMSGGYNSEGFVVDFKHMKEITEYAVLDKIDHQCLNTLTDHPFHDNPTSERLLEWAVLRLQREIKRRFGECVQLKRVKIWESSTSYVEWTA